MAVTLRIMSVTCSRLRGFRRLEELKLERVVSLGERRAPAGMERADKEARSLSPSRHAVGGVLLSVAFCGDVCPNRLLTNRANIVLTMR